MTDRPGRPTSYRPCVGIALFNRNGLVFAGRRANKALREHVAPGHEWQMPQGGIDKGEDPFAAALRELQEELGWQPARALEHLFKLLPCEATGQEFIEVYRTLHNGPFYPAPMELETGAFFGLGQIREWAAHSPRDFSPVFLQCLRPLDAQA